MKGKVYIVGVGPGDPDLITLKAVKVIQQADVILYDRLINESLLNFSKHGDKIYVGKGIGEAWKQEKINDTLVKEAEAGKIVVRMKGGDPTVFGRGEEECLHVSRHGIPCEIIPGVSSAIAVPEVAGIPITSRLVGASGFAVVSGTRVSGELDPDFIPKKGTVIILMGIHDIEKVEKALLMKRERDEKVAIIENGTLPCQRVIKGQLKDLTKLVKENKVRSPAVLVVGEVIDLSLTLK